MVQQCVIVSLFEKMEKTTHCLGVRCLQLRELWKVKRGEDQTQRHQSTEFVQKNQSFPNVILAGMLSGGSSLKDGVSFFSFAGCWYFVFKSGSLCSVAALELAL